MTGVRHRMTGFSSIPSVVEQDSAREHSCGQVVPVVKGWAARIKGNCCS
jgi:hypothetical protein